MTPGEFVDAAVALGRRLAPAPLDLLPLVSLGRAVSEERQRPLRHFARSFAARPEWYRAYWLGRVELDRATLSPHQHRALDLLGLDPDLFGPSGNRYDEVSHTRTIAWALGARELSEETIPAFLSLLATKGEPHPQDLPRYTGSCTELRALDVEAEHTIPGFGRIDVWMASPTHVFAIEGKLLAPEGVDQTGRYHRAGRRPGEHREWHVVFLTMDETQEPAGPALKLTLVALLRAWLPIAAGGRTESHAHLGRYLATLARVCGVCDAGKFESWSFLQRRRVVDFILDRES